MRWTAIVLAGQRPGIDPLAAAFGTERKALIPVGGEAMLSRVLQTLLAVPAIGRIRILAQDAAALRDSSEMDWVRYEGRVQFEASGTSISGSLIDATCRGAADWPVLVTTADHALLTPAMVEAFVRGAEGADLAVALVERRTMLAAYPETRRTWLRFRGGAYTGANLFAFGSPEVEGVLAFWRSIERDRKKGWRIVGRFGPRLLLRALTRTITLERAIARAGRQLGIEARPVLLAQAEAGIDVDKPEDHRLAEGILAARRRATD